MNQLNPTAICLWVFLMSAGYLAWDGHGAVIGLCVGSGLSLFAQLRGR